MPKCRAVHHWLSFGINSVGGLCRGVTAGDVQVTFNVGDCVPQSGYQTGGATTGYRSVSRIILEELEVEDPANNIQ